jgi:hypothetical protein
MGIAEQAQQRQGILSTTPTASKGGETNTPKSTNIEIHKNANEMVRVMQDMMNDLKNQLALPENRLKVWELIQRKLPQGKQISGISSERDLFTKIKEISDTGIGSSGERGDGIWGRKTQAAIKKLNEFISNLTFPTQNVQLGTGESPYQTMESKTLEKIAEHNVNAINSLFEDLELRTRINISAITTKGIVLLDMVTKDLTKEGSHYGTQESIGSEKVTVGNLSSVIDFFHFISTLTLSYSQCKPLSEQGEEEIQEYSFDKNSSKTQNKIKKLAQEILINSLFKIDNIKTAQTENDIERFNVKPTAWQTAKGIGSLTDPYNEPFNMARENTQAGEAAKSSNEATESLKGDNEGIGQSRMQEWLKQHPDTTKITTPVTVNNDTNLQGICLNVIDDFIIWFDYRAWSMQDWLYKNTQSKNPLTNQPVTKKDIDNANQYRQLIQAIRQQWMSIRELLENHLSSKQKTRRQPIVTINMLTAAINHAGGLGGIKSGRGNNDETGMRVRPGISGSDTEVLSGRGKSLKGPIQTGMILENTYRDYRLDSEGRSALNVLKNMTRGNYLPSIDLVQWRSGDWKTLAIRNLRGESKSEKYQLFIPFARNLQTLLDGFFAQWRDQYANRGMVTEEDVRVQEDTLDDWDNAIMHQIEMCKYERANAMKAARDEGEEPYIRPGSRYTGQEPRR